MATKMHYYIKAICSKYRISNAKITIASTTQGIWSYAYSINLPFRGWKKSCRPTISLETKSMIELFLSIIP